MLKKGTLSQHIGWCSRKAMTCTFLDSLSRPAPWPNFWTRKAQKRYSVVWTKLWEAVSLNQWKSNGLMTPSGPATTSSWICLNKMSTLTLFTTFKKPPISANKFLFVQPRYTKFWGRVRKDRCSSSGNLEAVLQHRPVIKSCLNEVKLTLID